MIRNVLNQTNIYIYLSGALHVNMSTLSKHTFDDLCKTVKCYQFFVGLKILDIKFKVGPNKIS